MTRPTTKSLAVGAIRLDGGTQPRESTDAAIVERYCEAIADGAKLPPVVVFEDRGVLWLADGFHRIAAHALVRPRAKIAAEVHRGTLRDAILYSVGANAEHGAPRTRADARRAVLTLLRDKEWAKKSDRWIAKTCRVSDKTVAKYRAEIAEDRCGIPHLREGRDGKTYSAPTRRSSTTTTVTYDGDPGPDEEVWEPDASDPRQVAMFEEEAARATDRGAVRGDPPAIPRRPVDPPAVHPRSGRLPPESGAGFDESGPISLVPRSETWRDVLGLPAGAVGASEVLAAADRTRMAAATAEGGVISAATEARIDGALARGLSAWFTRPAEAELLVEVALRDLREPTAKRPWRVLEPSAGDGALVRALLAAADGRPVAVDAVEVDPRRAERLDDHGDRVTVECADFLDYFGDGGGGATANAYDVVIMNPPYEGGLDGRFLATAMRWSSRIAALLRLNALTGAARYEQVWSACGDAGEWELSELVLLRSRPEFDGPGDLGARSDYAIVRMDRRANGSGGATKVRWA